MLIQSFALAFESIYLNKLRSFLTMIGIIIGVMAVTIISMISNTFQSYIKKQFESMGHNTIFIQYAPLMDPSMTPGDDQYKLRPRDLDYLKSHNPEIKVISGMSDLDFTATVKTSEKEAKTDFESVDEPFFEIMKYKLKDGRFFTPQDFNTNASVCLVSEFTHSELLSSGETSLVGKNVVIKESVFRVVGILEPNSSIFGEMKSFVFVPNTTAMKILPNAQRLTHVLLSIGDKDDASLMQERIWESLMTLSENHPVYFLASPKEISGLFTNLIGMASLILGGVACLSLLVGGVGIMNIMLVTVAERTREIGLRKALGAKRKVILQQFLIESVVLSLCGGMIGMLLAFLIGKGLGAIAASAALMGGDLEIGFSLVGALYATIFSVLVGIVFGYYPAKNAAKLDPIVALRRD